jgi:Protein of unknown function (DUF3631)/Domain of unknown function (DUF4326)
VTLVSAAADQKQSLGIQLLADLRTVFGDADVMFTDTTLEKLHKLEESPWMHRRPARVSNWAAMPRARAQVNATPKRVQLRRTKGWRKPEGAISVARPHKWGNAFVVGTPGAPGPISFQARRSCRAEEPRNRVSKEVFARLSPTVVISSAVAAAARMARRAPEPGCVPGFRPVPAMSPGRR